MKHLVRTALALALAAVPALSQTTTGQAATAPAPKTVPLVAETCPVVHPGDRVALDWNPGFDHPGVVTGLYRFTLIFAALDSDGLPRTPRRQFEVSGIADSLAAQPIGNGYFHIELRLGRIPHGTYRATGATSFAKASPDYQGEPLTMLNSPVQQRFCITVQ